eukprot:m.230862 g.230862  ORF g.230862 m.230862 type:complete len:254 (+) comp26030_c0_seq20:1506-2267(+)
MSDLSSVTPHLRDTRRRASVDLSTLGDSLTKSDFEGKVESSQGAPSPKTSPVLSPQSTKRNRRLSLNTRRRTKSIAEISLGDVPAHGTPLPQHVSTAAAHFKSHVAQPSTTSSTDFNLNQMWKSDEVWEGEAERLQSEIEELNVSFSKGHLRAFGNSADNVYDELEKMRREQHDLFEMHIKFEQELLADLGKPVVSASNADSKGFDQTKEDSIDSEANLLLVAMNGVCKSIQTFTASNSAAIRKSVKKSVEPV